MKSCKALTVYQPYASFLCMTAEGERIKRYETRHWQTSYRGPMAIHAGQRQIEDWINDIPGYVVSEFLLIMPFEDLAMLPRGAIVGGGNLVACHLIDQEFVRNLSEREYLLGDYRLGRYAWEFEDMRTCDPVPSRGKQGIWTWEYGSEGER